MPNKNKQKNVSPEQADNEQDREISVEDKWMRLVVSMFSLFLDLMLSVDDNILQGCHLKGLWTNSVWGRQLNDKHVFNKD